MDLQIIGLKIEKQSNTVIEIRNKLARKYSWKENDARLTIFNKLNNILTSASLGFFLMHTYLLKKDWWDQFQKNDVKEKDIQNALNEYEMFYRIGLVINLCSSIESSFRIYLRALDTRACNNGKAEFKSIYSYLLKKINLKQNNFELLDLLRNIRNTIHNNGLFFPPNEQNQSVTYNNTTYNFEVGKLSPFVSTDFVIDLAPPLINLVEQTVTASPLKDIGYIAEIS